MRVKRFIDHLDAVRYAHRCQQGGYSVALVIKPRSFLVCKHSEARRYKGWQDSIEFMTGAINE